MVMTKRPGWYYTTDGRLRYHDDLGWTEYYMEFDEVRALDGSPPPPMTMLDQVKARETQVAARIAAQGMRRAWWRRGRHR